MRKKNLKQERPAERGHGETVVVFGTQRIGAIYALRNGRDPKSVVLSVQGGDAIRGFAGGSIRVVRVSESDWKPSTTACERRSREMELELKRLKREGIEITEEVLS